jgi:hypothetical protein
MIRGPKRPQIPPNEVEGLLVTITDSQKLYFGRLEGIVPNDFQGFITCLKLNALGREGDTSRRFADHGPLKRMSLQVEERRRDHQLRLILRDGLHPDELLSWSYNFIRPSELDLSVEDHILAVLDSEWQRLD